MEKIIKVNEQEIKLVSNAATPMHYRRIHKSDLFKDFSLLETQLASGEISGEVFEILEKVVHIMAHQADKEGVPENIEEWLAQFELMDFVNALPAVVEMWSGETESTSEAKKKNEKPSEG